jgi:hypothetical protein
LFSFPKQLRPVFAVRSGQFIRTQHLNSAVGLHFIDGALLLSKVFEVWSWSFMPGVVLP